MKMKNRVLAVLALALLMINMLPVRVAEAADAEIIELKVPWYGVETTVTIDTSLYPYYMYTTNSGKNGGSLVYMSDRPITVQIKGETSGNAFFVGKCGGWSYTENIFPVADCKISTNSFNPSVTWYSNHDVYDKETGELYLAKNILSTGYSPDAPYLKNVVFSNVNNFLLDGNTDFTQSIFKYTFELGNADSDFVSRKVNLSGYVYLPSKEFIDKAKDYYWGGRDTLDEYYAIYSCEYYPTWLKSLDLGDGSTCKKWYFTTEFDCTDSAVLRLSHQDIYDLIEQTNGIDLGEYYGLSDTAYMDHVLKGYMWVHRLDGIVYTTYSDMVNYGNLTSFVCSTYLKDPVVSTGYSDPFLYGPPVDFVGPMLPDSNVHQSIEQAYKEALEEARAEKEYEDDLEIDLDSEDLFSSFKSLSKGLATLSGSFRNIAVAVGNVFAFFPDEITGLLFGGLVVCIFIAIYKAIRG